MFNTHTSEYSTRCKNFRMYTTAYILNIIYIQRYIYVSQKVWACQKLHNVTTAQLLLLVVHHPTGRMRRISVNGLVSININGSGLTAHWSHWYQYLGILVLGAQLNISSFHVFFLLPLFVISERRNNISWKRKVKVVLSWPSQLLLAQVISYICHMITTTSLWGVLGISIEINLNKVVLVSLFTIDSVSMKDLKIVPVHLSKNYMHRVVGRARKQSENKFFTNMIFVISAPRTRCFG